MKFTDVKTLNHLLKEYGNTPGKNMPTANKDLGFQGNNSLSKTKKIPASPTTAKVSASPTFSNSSKPKSVQVEPSDKDNLVGNAKIQKAKHYKMLILKL